MVFSLKSKHLALEPLHFAVIGNPINHSLSPFIHQHFATTTSKIINYQKILAPSHAFAEIVEHFFGNNGQGLNITLPFKQEAFALADYYSERAQLAAAVNTLMIDNHQRLYGDNTDGFGLICDLETNLLETLQGKNILLIGAGGAARGVIMPLIEAKPKSLTIVNRTISRVDQIIEQFCYLAKQHNVLLIGGGLQLATRTAFDIVINATSFGLSNHNCMEFHIKPNGLAYDMMYGPAASIFLNSAKQKGARGADGLGMLVEQAAESFLLWHKIKPPTQNTLKALRQFLIDQSS